MSESPNRICKECGKSCYGHICIECYKKNKRSWK